MSSADFQRQIAASWNLVTSLKPGLTFSTPVSLAVEPEFRDLCLSENGSYSRLYLKGLSLSCYNFSLTSNFFITVTQALLAGNTIVFKHSEECPLSREKLDEMFKEAGFPEGVFSTIYGDGEGGKMLVDQDINMIHFTGSTKVGEYLYKVAAEKFIPAILEMSGSSPGIIFADADLEKAVPSVCEERFRNCGQFVVL